MRNFFDFKLTGKKFFPIWILFYLLFITPYGLLIFKLSSLQLGETPPFYLLLPIIPLIIIAYVLMFFMSKLIIEGISYKENCVRFNGKFSIFLGKFLLGLFLSIITLGVYTAWFICDIQRYFIDESSYNSDSFKFKGTGSKLFVIILLTCFIPITISSIALGVLAYMGAVEPQSSGVINQIISIIILIPYYYCVYKWMVNIDYKGYNITWKTNFWSSAGQIVLQLLLSSITLGIYYPMAAIKLYGYFVNRTVAKSGDIERKFGYSGDNLKDFLFIWGQILITVVTLGIYYPWMLSKVGKLFIRRTYINE